MFGDVWGQQVTPVHLRPVVFTCCRHERNELSGGRFARIAPIEVGAKEEPLSQLTRRERWLAEQKQTQRAGGKIMSDYDEAVKKGAVYSPSYRPPGGTIADNIRKNRESGGGGSGGGSGGGCFVATAAFGDFNAPEVVFLRAFRDEWLSQSALGRGFIQAYYAVSPPLAEVIAKSESLRGFARRFILRPTISLLRYFKHR